MKPGKFHEKAEFEIDNAAKTINVAAYYAGDVNTREFHRVGRCSC